MKHEERRLSYEELLRKLEDAEKRADAAEKKVVLLEAVNSEWEKDFKEVCDRYNALLSSRYKRSSETIDKDQLSLFDEAELDVCDGAFNDEEEKDDAPVRNDEEERNKIRKYVRRKVRNACLALPADTPVKEIRVESHAPRCSVCGGKEVKTGERVYEYVSKHTSYTIVRKIVDVYSCPKCEGDGNNTTAEDGNILKGTVCDPYMLASVIDAKMGNGLPLYRIAENFRKDGVNITRHLLSSWIMHTGSRLLENYAPVLEDEVMRCDLVNADETPVNVLTLKDKKGGRKAPNSKSNAYMVVRAGTDKDNSPGPVVFNFTDNRRNETIHEYFKDFKGLLQTDGLSGYANAGKLNGNLIHLGCLVHARRKAVEAAGDRKEGEAANLVRLYARIFHEEGLLTDAYVNGSVSEDEFLIKRRETLLPLFEDLKAKMEDLLKLNLNGKLRKACEYYMERYESLIKFLDYSCATSSNQKAENAIRPFVVGRKNWLFCITAEGAEVSALYYSIVETCKALNINTVEYLTHLFMNAGNIKDGDVEGWRNILPGYADTTDARDYIASLSSAVPDSNRTEPYILRGKKNK